MILEELIHAYQHSKVGGEAFNNAKLNYEIEAKLGWLQYEIRKGYNHFYDGIDKYNAQLGHNNGTKNFLNMIEEGYKDFPIEYHDEEFNFDYELLVRSLRSISAYSDSNKYPEQNTARNLDIIEGLNINCPEL